MYKPHNDRLFKFLGYSIPEWGQISVGKHNTSKVEINPVPVPSIAAVVGPTAVETALSPSEIPVPPLQAEERAIIS